MKIVEHSFERFAPQLPDPIFGLMAQFQSDARPNKVNLGIGMYYNEAGELPVLRSVWLAKEFLKERNQPSRYLPMAGYSDYCCAARALVFGDDADTECIATIQTLGGTGALRIGAEVLKRHFPEAEVWVSDTGWDNHLTIFSNAGFSVRRYPYLDKGSYTVDFEAMYSCLERLPRGSIVLLHACCHNPTGADLSKAQWLHLAELVRDRGLLPFFDFAYQGFAVGIDEDAYAIRLMERQNMAFVVASSFSKNFALYGERCGALFFCCQNESQAGLVQGQMEYAVRGSYSNPPLHGADIISYILHETGLCDIWRTEVTEMRERISCMRQCLLDALSRNSARLDFYRLSGTRGMFIDSGLSPTEVDQLRSQLGIYLAPSGRLCLAGLNQANVEMVAEAILDIVDKRSI